MQASDILVTPNEFASEDDIRHSLWDGTLDRMDAFLPGFMDEVFPPPPSPLPVQSPIPPDSKDDGKEEQAPIVET